MDAQLERLKQKYDLYKSLTFSYIAIILSYLILTKETPYFSFWGFIFFFAFYFFTLIKTWQYHNLILEHLGGKEC